MMFQLLLGHLAGDYLLQNQWMALNKSKNTKIGWLAALIHCVIYTFAVCLFMWNFEWQWIIIVFLTHFPIDKFSIGEWYMENVKGYGLKNFVNNVTKDYLDNSPTHNILLGGFTAVVYAITDNTMHLILMWIGYNILYVW